MSRKPQAHHAERARLLAIDPHCQVCRRVLSEGGRNGVAVACLSYGRLTCQRHNRVRPRV